MEFSSQETPAAKPASAGANRLGLVVFVIAVIAVLVYASQQEHDFVTLAILCAVLLVGEVLAAYQWYHESKREAINDAAPRILEAFDMRMKQSFANQEIIHKEVHADFEALSKQLASLENAVKYLANRQEENTKLAAAGSADDRTEELADAVAQLHEKLNENAKELAELIEAQNDTIRTHLSGTKSEGKDWEAIDERLDAIVATQDEILEKFESITKLDAGEEALTDEIFIDADEADAVDSDEDFPLPQNMFERAQAANAESVASAVSKLIADVPAKEPAPAAPKCLVVIEYFSAKPEAPVPAEPPPAATEPQKVSEESIPEQRPIAEGELPLIEDLPHTALILKAQFGPGERPFLRGNAPGLSLKKSVPMDYSGSNLWRFDFGPMKADAEITIFRNDTNEALGAPFKLRAGKVTTLAFSPNA